MVSLRHDGYSQHARSGASANSRPVRRDPVHPKLTEVEVYVSRYLAPVYSNLAEVEASASSYLAPTFSFLAHAYSYLAHVYSYLAPVYSFLAPVYFKVPGGKFPVRSFLTA